MTARILHLTTRGPDEVQGTLVALNRRATARFGHSASPLSSFAREHLEHQGWTVASPVFAHRLLSRAVAHELTVHAPGVTARAFGSAVRELLRVEADLDVLAHDDVPRVRELARVTARYTALLREQHLVDGAEVLARAAQTIASCGPLTLFGYVRLTLDELRLLDALAGAGSRVYLPWTAHALFHDNEQAALWLEQRGWTVERETVSPSPLTSAFLQGEVELSFVQARACANPEQEVRAALADVKRLQAQGVPWSDIALVVADDGAWGALVQAVAWEYGVPIDVTAAVPLGATRVGTWLSRALDVVERGATFERGARLLGHPLDQGLEPDAWARIRKARPSGLSGWLELNVNLSAFDWPEQDDRASWVARLTAVLAERDVPTRAALRGSLDAEALRALQSELAALAEPAEEGLSREVFVEELRTLLALLAVTPRPSGNALELLTPYALVGASAPHVLVLGLSEGQWPPPLHDDAVLDFVERQRLRRAGVPLEVPGSLARREMLSFWSLLRAVSGPLTLSYAQRSANGDETLPSAYLARLGVTLQVYEHTVACSAEELRRAQLQRELDDEVLAHARFAHAVECRRESSATYDEYDGLTGLSVHADERVFSASQLRTLGTCAFQWWLSSLLRLSAFEDDENDTLSLGQLQHAVLRVLAERAKARPELDAREVMLSELDDALHAAEVELGWPQTPQWVPQRFEVRARLQTMIQAPAFLAQSATITRTEADFEGTWRGFRVRGQVDRIDDLGGKYVVIDYKSGKSKPWGVQDTDRKLTLDIQLPIYQQVGLPALIEGAKPGGAHYLSIKSGEVIARVSLNETAFDAFAARAHEILQTGAFVPSPDVQAKACSRCPFPPVCRAGPRLSRKEAP